MRIDWVWWALWAYPWEMVLITLVNVGRLGLKVGSPVPWFWALDCAPLEEAS